MNKLITSLLAAAAMVTAVPVETTAADFREHRAVWMTPYLGEWPSGLRASSESNQRTILKNLLNKLQQSGVNVIYFHVRSHCDANYRSKYEPWSKFMTGTRGVEPPFDPLEYLLEQAHERGIEIYAWVNPYRYCGQYSNGESPLDYENSHPDWLIVQQGKESILNPALEEVKQRICDVIADICENYDIDGVVFDDYFYSNPTPYTLDADLYNAAKEADPGVGTQLEWRVNNVNEMVRRVATTIKDIKPYLPFGISPAGVASPPNIKTLYGLDPAPDSDWQYSSIASDPLNWYKNHYVDFMAPQIYWTDKFDVLQSWWNNAARSFDRHLYSAITLSSLQSKGGAEFSREVEYSRDLLADNTSGQSFFRVDNYINTTFRDENNKVVDFYQYMAEHAYATRALMPVRPWNNVYSPAYITNLHRDGNTLTWDAVEGMRYTVYAFAAGEPQLPYNSNLLQVRYTNTYEIPADGADLTYGVAVYDRYGNEYAMTTEGAARGEAVNPVLTYPADGAAAAALFDFAWEPTGRQNTLEVATDPEFKDLVVLTTTEGNSLSSYTINKLEEGKSYYWRVRTAGVNGPDGVSETRTFVASRVSMTGPVTKDEPTTPTLTWTPAYDGAEYMVEISRNTTFTQVMYTATTTETSHTVVPGSLYSGHRFYARVTATRQGRQSVSDYITFWTADKEFESPRFISPAADGVTLHANECIEVERPEGATTMLVQICANDNFTGGIYRRTITFGDNATPELGTIRIQAKNLVDGNTYYVRVVARYYTQDNLELEKETDYRYSSFVYSATQGIDDVRSDDSRVSISPEGLLSMGVSGNTVTVYSADGVCVYSESNAAAETDLSSLAGGVYIIKVDGITPAVIKWAK